MHATERRTPLSFIEILGRLEKRNSRTSAKKNRSIQKGKIGRKKCSNLENKSLCLERFDAWMNSQVTATSTLPNHTHTHKPVRWIYYSFIARVRLRYQESPREMIQLDQTSPATPMRLHQRDETRCAKKKARFSSRCKNNSHVESSFEIQNRLCAVKIEIVAWIGVTDAPYGLFFCVMLRFEQ
jgi:hypothetical protein